MCKHGGRKKKSRDMRIGCWYWITALLNDKKGLNLGVGGGGMEVNVRYIFSVCSYLKWSWKAGLWCSHKQTQKPQSFTIIKVYFWLMQSPCSWVILQHLTTMTVGTWGLTTAMKRCLEGYKRYFEGQIWL